MVLLKPIHQYSVFLDGWGIWLTVVVTEKGAFFVVKELCEVLGIADYKQQYQQLKAHESAAPLVDKLSVKFPYGRRTTYCMHQGILGGWLFMVNPRLLRPEFRPRLYEFQQKAYVALNRIFYGEVDSTLVVVEDGAQPGVITQLSDWLGKPDKPIELSPPDDETEDTDEDNTTK
jgi:hypothetical protein